VIVPVGSVNGCISSTYRITNPDVAPRRPNFSRNAKGITPKMNIIIRSRTRFVLLSIPMQVTTGAGQFRKAWCGVVKSNGSSGKP